jgi:hypothetical protein
MATSRRTRSSGGSSSNRDPSGKNKALEPNVSSIDPNEPDAPAEAAPEASSGSSRRGAARASRKMQAQSSSKTPAWKSARVYTPEEQLARKKALKNGIKLGIGLIVLLAAVVAAWWFLGRENPREQEAIAALRTGRDKLDLIQKSINNRKPENARAAYAAALKAIQIPVLGNAKDPIDPNDPMLADKKLANDAVALGKEIRETEGLIDKVERDNKADANLRTLQEGFRKLLELDDAALIEHEKFAGLFLTNPVEPPAGARDDYVKEYSSQVKDVQSQMIRIDQEKDRRLAAITSDQEKQAHGEVKALVKQEQFKAALDKLGEYQSKFDKGKFDGLKEFVDASAKQAWESAKSYAESRYTDYKAPGIPAAIGNQALKDARTRLTQVVDRFGIETYVAQAKELLEKYPTPQ